MLRDERCIMSALKTAEELHKKNDKLAHCWMACRTARCLGGGICASYSVPQVMDRIGGYDRDPDDREANRRGGVCARSLWWGIFNKYGSCYSCCKEKVKDLPNDRG